MTGATGVDATHFGSGTDNNVNIVVRNVAITTMNDYDSLSLNSPGILGARDGGGSGRVTIDVQGGTITTEGTEAYGIYGRNTGTGDIGISVRGGTITTESTGISRGVGALANGVYGLHQGVGDITITTAGDNAITTAGDNAHGIVAYHLGTVDSRTIAVTVGGSDPRRRGGGARRPGGHPQRPGRSNIRRGSGRGRLPPADGHGERRGDGRHGRGSLSRRRRPGRHRAEGERRRGIRDSDSGHGRHARPRWRSAQAQAPRLDESRRPPGGGGLR